MKCLRDEFKETLGNVSGVEEIMKDNNADYIKWLETKLEEHEPVGFIPDVDMSELKIEFDRSPTVFGIKSPTIWRHHPTENSISTLAFIKRAKGASDEDFDLLLKHLGFSAKPAKG